MALSFLGLEVCIRSRLTYSVGSGLPLSLISASIYPRVLVEFGLLWFACVCSYVVSYITFWFYLKTGLYPNKRDGESYLRVG